MGLSTHPLASSRPDPRVQGGNSGRFREVPAQQLHRHRALHRRDAHVQTDKEEGHVAGFATINYWTDDMEAAKAGTPSCWASSRTSSAPDQTGAWPTPSSALLHLAITAFGVLHRAPE